MKKYLYLLFFLFTPLFSSEAQQSFWETYTEALRGNKEAQFQVGVIFERGIGIEQNLTQAVQWYEKSAEQGYVDAQYNIAILYAAGRGVDMDESKAMMWLARAAKQKDHEARKLLLKIIDGDQDTEKRINIEEVKKSDIEEIAPTTLITQAGAIVYGKNNKCTEYKANTAFTSTSKQGQYYKISGIVTKKGWKPYENGSWIDESSVVIRR